MHKLSSKSKPKVKGSSGPKSKVPETTTGRHTPIELKTQVSRGVSPGGGTHRGGRAGPLGASTRKNGPKTDPKNGGGRRAK